MSTLKGQNLRILLQSGQGNLTCVGMATNCEITMSANTQDESTKDNTGMAALPEVTSKSWQVSVDSLKVTDVANLLQKIKDQTLFTVMWNETETSDNQTIDHQAWGRQGQAYITDFTVTFNDRETASMTVQLTGNGELSTVSSSQTGSVYPVSNVFTKGQFVRLFITGLTQGAPACVIAAAKNLQLHVSCQVEQVTTKDTEGDWEMNEITGISYDITSTAYVRSNDTIATSVSSIGLDLGSIESYYESATPVNIEIANVSGANQRVKGSTIMSGKAVITQLRIQAQNKQIAVYDTTLNGYGDYTVGS